MHPNKLFKRDNKVDVLSFTSTRGFGILAISTSSFPLTSHIPFCVNEDGTQVAFHLAKNNPMRVLLNEGVNAKLCVMGPHAYISPDWYGVPDQVPTWNYVASEIAGFAKSQDEVWLKQHVKELSANFEQRLPDKIPWTIDKMSNDAFDRMAKGIFGVAMSIDHWDSTWKLGQNKPDTAREGMANALDSIADPPASNQLAKLIRHSAKPDG